MRCITLRILAENSSVRIKSQKKLNFRLIKEWLEGITSRKTVVHFLHIGKTGGTAIKNTLRDHTHNGPFRILLHDHKTTLPDIPQKEKVFFCVRDPIDRFVSGFYSRQRQGRPTYYAKWRKEERIAFGQFSTPNELGLALSSQNKDIASMAKFAMRSISHVNTSYWDWFKDEQYLLERAGDILYICRQERLAEDFDELVRRLELSSSLSLPVVNSAGAHSNPETLDKRLDDAAAQNLRDWYAKDYDFMDFIHKTFNRK